MLTRWRRWLVALGALSLIAACGGDDDAEGSGDAAPAEDAVDTTAPGTTSVESTTGESATSTGAPESQPADDAETAEPVTLRIGILPIADVAPLYYGMDRGYFEEENLVIEPAFAQGGAAIVPGVLSNEFQIGFSNQVSLMLARQNRVPVQVVANAVYGADAPDRGTNALMVDPDSGLTSLADLAGKTFAVTTLSNLGEVTVRATLEKAGVDHSDITFVEMPFPDMNGALESGAVDVAWLAEPFITIGESMGFVSLADPMYESVPGQSIALFFADEGWLADNAEVAERFQRAINRSLQAAADDPEGARAIISTYSQTPPEILEQIALASWGPDINVDSLREIGSLAVKYGVLDGEPDIDALIWSP